MQRYEVLRILITLMRIRILLFTLMRIRMRIRILFYTLMRARVRIQISPVMRIRIQLPKMMWIHVVVWIQIRI
jgi:hypothetical protein